MPGRGNEPCGFLGRPLGESIVVQGRKAQSVVNEFQDGWSIVAARVGAKPKLKFYAAIRRCGLPQCKRRTCLGHEVGVRRLAEKIRSTYG